MRIKLRFENKNYLENAIIKKPLYIFFKKTLHVLNFHNL